MEERKYENNIVYDSYYLVTLFEKDKKPITQLQVQKLMFLFEAFYMNVVDTESLYDCHFNAWTFGPVAIPLYKEYNKFGEYEIKLSDEQKKIGENIDSLKKEILNRVYEVFGGLTSRQLVDLTHMINSPWYETWMENGEHVIYGEKSYINKPKTKKWFRETFIEDVRKQEE